MFHRQHNCLPVLCIIIPCKSCAFAPPGVVFTAGPDFSFLLALLVLHPTRTIVVPYVVLACCFSVDKLLDVRGARPGKQVKLEEAEIKFLCTESRRVFMEQPTLLELEAPLKICGKFPRRLRGGTCCDF